MWFYTQTAAVHEEGMAAVTLDILGEKKKPGPTLSVPANASACVAQGRLGAGGAEEGRRKGRPGRGTGALAGRREDVGVGVHGRKAAGSPHWQPRNATGILSGQLSSSPPAHRAAQPCQAGTGGDKDTGMAPAALSWLAPLPCGGSAAAQAGRAQRDRPSGAVTATKCLGRPKPGLRTLRSEQEREKQ